MAGGDAYYYYYAANLLVSGHGFINPYLYIPHGAHHVVQSADFPPLFIFVLAIPSVVGLKSFLVARVWCCILGTAAIGVCGYTGREIGGRRVGLIAAFLLAVYPNIWMTDELALSEALAPLLVATLLLFAYRFWKDPSVKRGIWLGVALGIAMLGRDELTPPRRLPRRPAGAPGPGAQLEAALRRSRDRPLGHRTRGGALGRVQPEPVPKAGLHHPPDSA